MSSISSKPETLADIRHQSGFVEQPQSNSDSPVQVASLARFSDCLQLQHNAKRRTNPLYAFQTARPPTTNPFIKLVRKVRSWFGSGSMGGHGDVRLNSDNHAEVFKKDLLPPEIDTFQRLRTHPLPGLALPTRALVSTGSGITVAMTNVNWSQTGQKIGTLLDIKIGGIQGDAMELKCQDYPGDIEAKEVKMKRQAWSRGSDSRGYELCTSSGLGRFFKALNSTHEIKSKLSNCSLEQIMALKYQLLTIKDTTQDLAKGEATGWPPTTFVGASVMVAVPDDPQGSQPKAALADFGHAVSLEELIIQFKKDYQTQPGGRPRNENLTVDQQAEIDAKAHFDTLSNSFAKGIDNLIELVEQTENEALEKQQRLMGGARF